MTHPVKRPVLFANLSRSWGGGEVWHYTMAQQLAGRGWPISLLVWPGGALHRRAESAGLMVYPLALRSYSSLSPWSMAQLGWILGKLAPGVVILNASRELKVVGWKAYRSRVPKILFRRGIPQPLGDNPVNRWLLRRVPTRLIANSQATLDAMTRAFPDEVTALRPVVLHNGIDPASWNRPKQNDSAPGVARIAAVGRLTFEKGFDRLIRVLPTIQKRVPTVELLIVGDGSERSALESLVSTLNLTDAVRFIGHSDEIAKHLVRCNLFCLPSRWEGFGYVLLEAMLLKLPCVAFDITAAREIIVPEVTGVLVPEEEPETLANALADLLQDPARCRIMGCAGRERVLRTFQISQAVDKLERLLNE